MALDPAAISRVARLARIRIEPAEAAPLAAEMDAILGWIAQLEEVEIDGVAPLADGAGRAMALRADAVTDGGRAEAVLANAPDREGEFFAVPKVVE